MKIARRDGAISFACFCCLSGILLLLTGCGAGKPFTQPPATKTASVALHGKAHGGQWPVTGSTIQLYAAGSSGYGVGAQALLSSPVMTDQNGNFTIPAGAYTCPSDTTEIYLVATGGNPGVGANNPAIAMMAALGPCANPTSSVYIDEVTTVGSVWALAQFLGPGAQIGTSSNNIQGLGTAFTNVNALVDISSGSSPGPSTLPGVTIPVQEIFTLADILASCVNSDGATACSALFAAATPPGGTAPANTLDAALDIALNPVNNVAALYALVTPQTPFQPTLSLPPANWTMGNAIETNPVPVLVSLSPPSLPVGSAPQSITINGTGFLSSSTVTFNGTSRATSYISSNQLTIPLTSTDLATTASDPVIVTNPVPGGGTSAAMYFAVTGIPADSGWTWMGGSSTVGSECSFGTCGRSSVYGTLGVAATGNILGSRDSAVSWTDHSGNLWLFGGAGIDSTGSFSELNDLWEFNPATNQWTWMGGSTTGNRPGIYGTLGIPAAGNVPGGRYGASSWTDSNGHLWLFGGSGVDSRGNETDLGDLWEFDSSLGESGEWTWMGGSSTFGSDCGGCGLSGVYGTLGVPAAGNIPGSRDSAVSWTDSSGDFWLFSGEGYDADGVFGVLDDLWKFDRSLGNRGEWTWMGGSNTLGSSCSGYDCGRPGIYGMLGVPAAGNIPGSRDSAVSWTDSSGHFWLFGGEGYDGNGNWSYLNDLWVFNLSTNQWTWMGGTSVDQSNCSPYGCYQSGVYGTLGVPAAGNTPGGRRYALSWTDSSGHLWLFGGDGYSAGTGPNVLNDLWEFDPSLGSLGEWAWVAGSNTSGSNCMGGLCGQPGVYGVLGVLSAGDTPGGHDNGTIWTDSNGRLWLFGGFGFDANGDFGYLNDLWVYQP